MVQAAPREEVEVSVFTTGGEGPVTIWLEGDYVDAFLSSGQLSTSDGKATVKLRASSVSSTFHLLARIAKGPVAALSVSVSATGFSTLRVQPSYAGIRAVTSLVASAYLKTSCLDLDQLPRSDGAPLAEGAVGAVLGLSSIPARQRIAVVVRAGHFAAGCADLDSVEPGATRDLSVKVYDLPLDLESSALNLTLQFGPNSKTTPSWNEFIQSAENEATNAFFGDTEASTVLDSMRDSLRSSVSSDTYETARRQGAWDAAVSSWLSAHPPSLHNRVGALLSAGAPALPFDVNGQVHPGVGDIAATFELISWGPLGSGQMPITPFQFRWSADANDTLHVSGSLSFRPSQLATLLADANVQRNDSASVDVPHAIANGIDCHGLAAKLSTPALSSCGATCLAAACVAGLTDRWDQAADASASVGNKASLSLTASAFTNKVGDAAQIEGANGTWVGTLTCSGDGYGPSYSISGNATAVGL